MDGTIKDQGHDFHADVERPRLHKGIAAESWVIRNRNVGSAQLPFQKGETELADLHLPAQGSGQLRLYRGSELVDIDEEGNRDGNRHQHHDDDSNNDQSFFHKSPSTANAPERRVELAQQPKPLRPRGKL